MRNFECSLTSTFSHRKLFLFFGWQLSMFAGYGLLGVVADIEVNKEIFEYK